MDSKQGRALFGSDGETFYVKWQGQIRYPMAPQLDAFYAAALQSCSFGSMCIDLREATALDSTAMGILARLGKFMLGRVGRRAILVYHPGDVIETLLTVGFDAVFVMVRESPEAEPELVEISGDGEARSLGATMLEAHEELMSLNERNEQEFRGVVGMLRRDLARQGEPR